MIGVNGVGSGIRETFSGIRQKQTCTLTASCNEIQPR